MLPPISAVDRLPVGSKLPCGDTIMAAALVVSADIAVAAVAAAAAKRLGEAIVAFDEFEEMTSQSS